MNPLQLHALPGNELVAERLAQALVQQGLDARSAAVQVHRFPDGESLVRLDASVLPPTPDAVLVCALDQPDTRTLPLLMAAATLRELGARRIGLLAPYLGYMRQDARFQPGEAISAPIYARLLSAHFDWLLTVDPHLHRIATLQQIYTLRARALSAAPLLADWIARNVEAPLVIGPDAESAQWAGAVAARAGAPLLVLQKTRLGDRTVRIVPPDRAVCRGRTPVLVDDVISTGRTLIAALELLRGADCAPPVCVAVHGLCVGDALPALRAAGAARVVCTTSVAHTGTPMDITGLLAEGVTAMLAS